MVPIRQLESLIKEDTIMRSYDLSPLHRFTVGFDNVGRLMDTIGRLEETVPAYPPYNIERYGDDAYRITMAVAGFSESDLEITTKENGLTISGKKTDENKDAEYLHRGIASRAFERRFELAAHIKVKGASLENGLLHVDLERIVPEELKPRKIAIGKTSEPKAITADKKSDDQAA